MTKAEATQRCKALVKSMKSTGWEMDVWDNLGWHYAIRLGPLSVHVSYVMRNEQRPEYFCQFGSNRISNIWGNQHRTFPDPNDAVKYTLEDARTFVDERVKFVIQGYALAGLSDSLFFSNGIRRANTGEQLSPLPCPWCGDPAIVYRTQCGDMFCVQCSTKRCGITTLGPQEKTVIATVANKRSGTQ